MPSFQADDGSIVVSTMLANELYYKQPQMYYTTCLQTGVSRYHMKRLQVSFSERKDHILTATKTKFQNQVKCLGVTFDQYLNYKEQQLNANKYCLLRCVSGTGPKKRIQCTFFSDSTMHVYYTKSSNKITQKTSNHLK